MQHSRQRRGAFLAMTTIFLISLLVMAGCGGAPAETPTTPSTTSTPTSPSTSEPTAAPTADTWQWPKTIHVAARGTSGQAKTVSFVSVMEKDTGSIIRVRPEALNLTIFPLLKNNDVVMAIMEKSALKTSIEATDENASSEAGPFMVAQTWVASLGSSGFMVRGDSDIYVPGDIKPGTKVAVNSMKEGSTGPVKALFNWAGLDPENDIVWVNTGSTEGVPRAVVEGRADICFTPPISPSTFDAASSPHGIRFINMNPNEDPEGHKRFLEIRPMYTFFPSQSGPENTIGTWMPTGYTLLVSNYDSDPDLIYHMAKWLDENFESYEDTYESNKFMSREHLMESMTTSFVPIHPGLVRYLEELGLWTPAHEARNEYNKAWIQQYIDAWDEALKMADQQGVKVDPLNEDWLELWENLKASEGIPLIGMHPGLEENAAVILPAGYVPPEPEPTIEQPKDISVEFTDVKGFHPGEHTVITIKTEPGAEVWLVFTMPTGNDSRFPENQPQVADENGIVVYEWESHSTIPSGYAYLTATAKKDGKEGVLREKKIF